MQLTKTNKAFKQGAKGIKGWRPLKAFTPKMFRTGPTPAVRQFFERPVRTAIGGSKIAGRGIAGGVGGFIMDLIFPEPVGNYDQLISGGALSTDLTVDSNFEEQNNIKSEPYNLIDISLNYKVDNIQLSLWSKNITDEKYAIRGYQFVLDPTYEVRDFQTFGDPMSIGITLDYNL